MAAEVSVSATGDPEGSATVSAVTSLHRLALVLLILILLAWIGLLAVAFRAAALPDRDYGTVVAVFPPAVEPQEAFAAILDADAALVRSTWLANVWVVHSDREGLVGRLRSRGAWIAFTPLIADPLAVGGCFGIALRLK